jgi:hypothetical protein
MTSVEGRSPRVLGCVLVAVLAALVLGAAPAFGALTFPFERQLAPSSGSFGQLEMGSVAVDDANGNTYVADSHADAVDGAVDVFNSAGTELAPLNGALTPAGSFPRGEVSVAVAANDGTGEVYVLDAAHDVVDVFESSGGYLCQITGSATPSASECDKAGSKTPAGGFSAPGGIAVDQATGDVYVVDENHGVVDVFSAGGEYLRQIELGSVPGAFCASCARGVAVDDFNGDVYVASYREVFEFDAAGAYVATWTGANTPTGSFGREELGVAADNTNGDVFVSAPNQLEPQRSVVDVFEASGGYVTRLGYAFNRPKGVAVDQASGRVYVSEEEKPGVVDVFGAALTIPDVTTQAAGEVHPTSATLQGTVNPDGFKVSDCHFDYGTEESYGQTAPCVPTPGAGSSPVAVHADIVGLQPGTTYHFRLQASNENCVTCTNYGGDETFATPPRPSIEDATATNVTSTSADLDATIDPNGFDTTYHFEWGVSTAYGTSVPVPDVNIGAGLSGVPVSVHLVGLGANTTYHWRVVAVNANGTTAGVDHTFVYSTAGAGLPDGRAYEMVTPPRKNGALIGIAASFLVEPSVSEDGSRVILWSIQCFGGASSCTAVRNETGSPYAFTRTGAGWVATALAPPAAQFGVSTAWSTSAGADTSLFSVPTPPAGEDDWYARQPDGSFVDIGPATSPSLGPLGPTGLAGSVETDDLSHIVWSIFTEDWPLDAQARARSKTLYEYVGTGNTAPILVAVSGGLGSTELISQCETGLGEGPGALSADGNTVFFVAHGQDYFGCASVVAPPVDEVWARIDESRSVLLSGRSPAGCKSAMCLGSPAGDARFEGASADGSKAFFTSTQQLMDSASEDSKSGDSARSKREGCSETTGVNGCNLYEYDFANPAGENLVDVSAGDTSGGGPRVQGVVAISGDGSHVYFVARGVLSGVANSQGQVAQDGAENLYVFERDAEHPQGRVVFVAVLPESDHPLWNRPPGGEAVEFAADVTPDGRFLVFTSHGALTADDSSTGGAAQVFRYDAQTGELVRISVGDEGFNDNGNTSCTEECPAENAGVASLEDTGQGPARLDPTMSNDGSYVFFTSPVGLTPRALNDVPVTGSETGYVYAQNVYEWHEGRVYLISDGRDTSGFYGGSTSDVRLIGTDATGADVFFTTSDQLVPQDTDTQLDVYDARICTASEPCVSQSAPGVGCAGEACHGTPPAPPAAAAAATAVFSGSGNLLSPPSTVTHSKAAKKKRHVKRRRAPARRRGRHVKGRRAAHGAVRASGRGRS